MDRIKKDQKSVRAAITKTVTAVDDELAKEDPDLVRLDVLLSSLNVKSEELTTLNENMKTAMLDEDKSDADFEAEMDTVEEYFFKIGTAKVRLNKVLNPKSPTPSVSSLVSGATAGGGKQTFKLPKIELKKFSGELTEWLGWWAQFQKIDEEPDIDASDKFQYLVQCMVPGSPARALVDQYPQSKENYPKAIEELKERFGKEKLLRQVYIRELLKMIMSKGQDSSGKASLTQLYDKINSHLRSLESLGSKIEPKEFLYPMIESSLPDEILVAWQRSSLHGKRNQTDAGKSELDYLLQFLKEEIDSEQERTLAKAGFSSESSEKKKEWNPKKRFNFEKIPTAAGLFNGEERALCVFCEKPNHESVRCFSAPSMSYEDRKARLYKKGACLLCLKPSHRVRHCPSGSKCAICGQRHHQWLCPGKQKEKPKPLNTSATEFVPTINTGLNCSSEIILQTLIVKIRNERNGKEKKVRVLIDSGSQRSYMLRTTSQKLGLQPTEKVSLNHVLFGGNHVTVKGHNILDVGLSSVIGNFYTKMKLLDQQVICGVIPRVTKGTWMSELTEKKIHVSDLDPNNPMEVEVLFGADNLGSVFTGRVVPLANGLTATETNFGWTLMGPLKRDDGVAMSVINMNIVSASIEELWKLETIGIRDPAESKSREEKDLAVRKHFRETVSRNEEGRYSVSLPWIDGKMDIPSNRPVAEKRLDATTKKLQLNGNLKNYEDIFSDWEKEGIITDCTANKTEKSGRHYIPHRAVLKQDSKTTPVRPVFDASCKTGRYPSLNDCLEKGPNLLELIPSILIRFRLGKIGLISDIRKAFLMIEVKEEDRVFLRFLWWQNVQNKTVRDFQHNRVVLGMNCSPFLLGAVIETHLESIEDDRRYVAENLLKSLYVDNCVTSLDSYEEYNCYKTTATELMAEAKMELRQWEHTRDNSAEKVTSVLGMKWDKNMDQMYCALIDGEIPEKITKRVILSLVQKFFDPLGFLCPTMLIPKLLLQKSWVEKTSWDEKVGPEMKQEFLKWLPEMSQIAPKIKIPRNCTGGMGLNRDYQLHTFSDASKLAYAATVFLRIETEDGVSVQLVQAKSRVAPIRVVTIPRLELLSCTIASRLTSSVKEALGLTVFSTFFWNDSTTALAWIKGNDEWGTFVGNRVKEICSLTKPEEWRHVPGVMNPADLPSRGCNAAKLLESRWWEGPDWLKKQACEWPSGDGIVDEELVFQERKKNTIGCLTVQVSEEAPWWVTKHQKYIDNVRVVAMVIRAAAKFRKRDCCTDQQPTTEEITRAEVHLFTMIQGVCFPKNEKVISGLNVVVGEDGLIRVKTRLLNRQDSVSFRYPVLLPNSHPLVDKMIRELHRENCHAGVQTLMGLLREKVWIIYSRKAVKNVVKSCIPCKKLAIRKSTVPQAPLPEDRVKDANVFDVTGIDLAGPLFLKNKKKCWIVLYTCAVYRAVHLELVDSLSAADFLWSWDRFVSRKSRPKTVYTDNGTNFVGTTNLFKTIDWDEVTRKTKHEKVEWKFNPPSAPWWGGWWERLIRSVKDMLKRMLGNSRLTRIELETILCKVESIVNRRPLSFVNNDPDDLIQLTPSMFMNDLCTSEAPEEELLTVDGLQTKYKNMRKLYDELRSRFRKEYLSQMVQRGKERKHHEFQVGDLVWIGDDNKKRIQWPMAKIMKLFPGKDGNTRVAIVKTAFGEFTRPLQRLYPMEISSKPELEVVLLSPEVETSVNHEHTTKKPELRTKCGRLIKVPVKFVD